MDDPGTGRRIGVDVGSVRIGVASSDPGGILATPVETVPRSKVNGPAAPDVARVCAIVEEYEAVEIVIGLPRTLRGESGSAVKAAEGFARALAEAVPGVPIRMADERLTTVSATRALRESGVRAKSQRGSSIRPQQSPFSKVGWTSGHLCVQHNRIQVQPRRNSPSRRNNRVATRRSTSEQKTVRQRGAHRSHRILDG